MTDTTQYGCWAALDYGEARIGIAVSDEEGSIAFARGHVSGRGTNEVIATRIQEALQNDLIVGIVVGLPVTLKGEEGLSARRARKLADAVKQKMNIEVVLHDERLTTAQAERSLKTLGVFGAERRKSVDAAAAAILLQDFLGHRKSF